MISAYFHQTLEHGSGTQEYFRNRIKIERKKRVQKQN